MSMNSFEGDRIMRFTPIMCVAQNLMNLRNEALVVARRCES